MHNFTVIAGELKIVADFCNCSIFDVLELSCVEFWEFLKDSIIYNNMQSDNGNEWLDNAWILQQKKPDREKLRKFKKGE